MKILFISHSTCATGAPMSLMRLMKWLKVNSDVEFSVVVGNKKELYKDYCKLCKTYTSPYADLRCFWPKNNIFQRICRKYIGRKYVEKKFVNKVKKEKYDLIFTNTVMNWQEVECLKDIQIPVICRVAELPFFVENVLGKEKFIKEVQYINHYIAVADVVKKMLENRYSIPSNKISIVNGVISHDLTNLQKLTTNEKKDFVIGGCGSLDWRKGSNIFLNTALLSQKLGLSHKFVWAGGNSSSTEYKELVYEATELLGLENIDFIGSTSNINNFYKNIDCLFMCSREDPFPLVVLEAAAHAKPVICFDTNIGSLSFIDSCHGFIISCYDLVAVIDAINFWVNNPSEYLEASDAFYSSVNIQYTVEQAGPEFLRVFNKYI